MNVNKHVGLSSRYITVILKSTMFLFSRNKFLLLPPSNIKTKHIHDLSVRGEIGKIIIMKRNGRIFWNRTREYGKTEYF